jgi:DNA-binding IclR family transcriptional regulator
VADPDRIRLEIAFEGGQALSVFVLPAVADELDRALADRAEGAVSFDAEDGRYAVAVRKIVFVKRFARESRVGFGAAS